MLLCHLPLKHLMCPIPISNSLSLKSSHYSNFNGSLFLKFLYNFVTKTTFLDAIVLLIIFKSCGLF